MCMFNNPKGSGKKYLILPLLTMIVLLLMSCELLFSETGIASFRLVDWDGVPTMPAWVAFRDGDAAWQRLYMPGADLVWSHLVTDPAGRYAFAVVYPGGRPVHLFAGTLDEIRCFTDISFLFPLPDTPYHVSGSISGLPDGSSWNVSLGSRTEFPSEELPPTYRAGIRVPSTYDVLAVRNTAAEIPDRLWLRRDLVVDKDISLPIDFTDPMLSTPGLPLRIPVSNGSLTAGSVAIQASTSSIRTGWLVPATSSASGKPELHYLGFLEGFARATDLLVVTGVSSGVQLLGSSDVANPPELDFSGLSDFDSTTFTDGILSWKPVSGTLRYSFMLPKNTGTMRYWADVTPGYAGESSSFAIPDLSEIDGWDPAWNFIPDDGVATGTAMGGNCTLDSLTLQSSLNRYAKGTRMWWASTPGYFY